MAKPDTLRKIAGSGRGRRRKVGRQGQREGKGKNGGEGEGRASYISDEPPDSEQPGHPDIIGSVTREDWICALEHEAPKADLNTNSGHDAHAVTLRKVSGYALI